VVLSNFKRRKTLAMSNKTAMMKLYDMLDEGQISEIAEIKEYFLMLEQTQIMNAWAYGVLSQGDKTAEQYYNEIYK
jgi:hypothetical protein